MWVLSCSTPACPTHSLRASMPAIKVRSSSQLSFYQDNPFAPQVVKAVDSLCPELRDVDDLVACNTSRVLKAFQNARVGSHHFGGSTGHGHDESGGPEALDQAFAEIVGAESAIVRSQLLAVAGAPYDTLEQVIGKSDSHGLGSLKDFGVEYQEVPLAEDGELDWDALIQNVHLYRGLVVIRGVEV